MSATGTPILERDGFLNLALTALEDLIRRPPERSEVLYHSIRMTSGTSGRTPIIMASEHPQGTPVGFRRANALVIAQGGNNARVGNTLFTLTNTQDETRILAIDDGDLKPELGELLRDYRPDAFRGFPSFIRRTAEYLGDDKRFVKAMKITGEKWTPSMRDDFERNFPNASFEIIYGIVEVGVFATRECPHLTPNHYHPVDDALVEVAEPDESGAGDLLISRPFYRDFWARRYRVGDVGRIDPEPCACGRESFELFGRKGSDFLKVAGAVVFREELDRVAALCKDLFDDYRVEVSRRTESGKEVGQLHLIVFRGDGSWSEAIASEIGKRFSSELFLTRTRTLENLVAAEYFDPLTVERRAEPFPFKSKAVKLSERQNKP